MKERRPLPKAVLPNTQALIENEALMKLVYAIHTEDPEDIEEFKRHLRPIVKRSFATTDEKTISILVSAISDGLSYYKQSNDHVLKQATKNEANLSKLFTNFQSEMDKVTKNLQPPPIPAARSKKPTPPPRTLRGNSESSSTRSSKRDSGTQSSSFEVSEPASKRSSLKRPPPPSIRAPTPPTPLVEIKDSVSKAMNNFVTIVDNYWKLQSVLKQAAPHVPKTRLFGELANATGLNDIVKQITAKANDAIKSKKSHEITMVQEFIEKHVKPELESKLTDCKKQFGSNPHKLTEARAAITDTLSALENCAKECEYAIQRTYQPK